MSDCISLGPGTAIDYSVFHSPHIDIRREMNGDICVNATFFDGTLWFSRYSAKWDSDSKLEEKLSMATKFNTVNVIASRYGGKSGVAQLTNDVMELCMERMDHKAKIVPYNDDGSVTIRFKDRFAVSVGQAEDMMERPDVIISAYGVQRNDIEVIGIVNSVVIMLDRVGINYWHYRGVSAELRLDRPALMAYGEAVLKVASRVCGILGEDSGLGLLDSSYIDVSTALSSVFYLPYGKDRSRPLIGKARKAGRIDPEFKIAL